MNDCRLHTVKVGEASPAALPLYILLGIQVYNKMPPCSSASFIIDGGKPYPGFLPLMNSDRNAKTVNLI